MPAGKLKNQKFEDRGRATKPLSLTTNQEPMEQSSQRYFAEENGQNRESNGPGGKTVLLQSNSLQDTNSDNEDAKSAQATNKVLTVLIADDHQIGRASCRERV